MEIAWNESLTLQLISAVQKVEDYWGIREWEDQEEMWRHIADELPLNFPGLLTVDSQELSDLCKTRFFMICRCFNDVFIKHTRHNCLTYKVMTALAGYSLRSDCNAYFREIGPQEHFRAIVSVGIERSEIEYCSSSDPGSGGLAASDEYSPDVVKHEVEEVRSVEEPRKDELLDEVSKESLDFLATAKSEDSSSVSGFVVKIRRWNVLKGLVGIPRVFCLKYMPRCHATLLTCIRNGKKYQIKYLPHRFSLSAGWPNFSRANGVKENDELVFRRLNLSTYQVSGITVNLRLRLAGHSNINEIICVISRSSSGDRIPYNGEMAKKYLF